MNYSTIKKAFEQKFLTEIEVVVVSPGRINIIGEHTDYNEGYVLPAAIDYYMYLVISKNDTNAINIYSNDFDEFYSEDISRKIERSDNSWRNLINGVVDQLSSKISGFDLAFGGNIPVGAGLSSSAALCCGLVSGLSELFSLGLTKWEKAKIAQKSEHEYGLVLCGIMDQFACLFGLTNHALLLNCKTNEFEEAEVDISGHRLVLINSNVKHSLDDSEYNRRRQESQDALSEIRQYISGVSSYQDLNIDTLKGLEDKLDLIQWKRAFHVTSENERVIKVKQALRSNQMKEVGQLLTEGHDSLKNYYDVTCYETDYLVHELCKYDSVLGARQVGGGFGGCVLALVKDSDISLIIEELSENYQKRYKTKPTHIPIRISRGCYVMEMATES